jgi:hypothetical protein
LPGGVFGAAGTAATIPTYSNEQKPTLNDVLVNAVSGAIFDSIAGIASTLPMAGINKQNLINGMKNFESTVNEKYKAARTAANPADAVNKYDSLLTDIQNAKTALETNSYVGANSTVKDALKVMDFLSERVTMERDGLGANKPKAIESGSVVENYSTNPANPALPETGVQGYQPIVEQGRALAAC